MNGNSISVPACPNRFWKRVKGSGVVVDDKGHSMSLCAGETILLPACTNEIKVEGEVRFLETYV